MKSWAIHTNLPSNGMVRLSHPPSGDSLGQETLLVPSADKQTCKFDTECSKHSSSLSALRSKGLSCSKMKWWTIYIILPIYHWMSLYIYIYVCIYLYMKSMYISICLGISKWKIFISEFIKYIHFYRETYHMSLEYAVKKRVSESIQQYERKLNTHLLFLNNKICAAWILQIKER